MDANLKNFTTKPLVITLSLSLGIGLSLIFSNKQSALAQSQDPQYQSNEQNVLYETPGNINPHDLMHRSVLGPSRDAREFHENTGENIENAATEFKRQRERLLNLQFPSEPENNN
ncbi:MAG: hypothetical protein QNJ54_04855 [Prochloraceae cyanobacterium]|nr:hypothetical protein [Prochloraceae cyanobacterium]